MSKGSVNWRTVRIEAVAILLLLLVVYWERDASWLFFGALFLAPDISAIGFIAGPRHGAIAYNVAHTIIVPAVAATIAIIATWPAVLSISIIWGAHIAFDRAIGYGLRDIGGASSARSGSFGHNEAKT